MLETSVSALKLGMKASHSTDLALSGHLLNGRAFASDILPGHDFSLKDPEFMPAREFRHLGLLFRAGGAVSLSRDKLRKIQNLFRFAFRRARRRWMKISDPAEKTRALVALAVAAIEKGLRNVAILDYYLKHVDDEKQIRLLDRWLAEEVLAGFRRSQEGPLPAHQLC